MRRSLEPPCREAETKHFQDVTELLAEIGEHPNRAAAAYAMGIASVVSNKQASRKTLEKACAMGLLSNGQVSRRLIDDAALLAMEIGHGRR